MSPSHSRAAATPRRPHPSPHTDKPSFLNGLKVYGVVLATLSGIGAYFGYGVAAGLMAKFGLDTGLWYSSPLELLSLSGEGVMGMLTNLMKTSSTEFAWSALRWGAGGAAIAATVWAVLLLAAWSHRLAPPGSLDLARLAGVSELHKASQEGRCQIAKRVLRSIVAGAIAGAVALPISLAMIVAGFAALLIFPLLGFSAGQAYADLAVLNPERCVNKPGDLRDAAKADKLKGNSQTGANCAELVSAAGVVVGRGRVVIARPSFVVFYRPAHKDAVLLQIKDGSLRVIDSLE